MLAQYEESIRITRQAALEAAETDSIITASGRFHSTVGSTQC